MLPPFIPLFVNRRCESHTSTEPNSIYSCHTFFCFREARALKNSSAENSPSLCPTISRSQHRDELCRYHRERMATFPSPGLSSRPILMILRVLRSGSLLDFFNNGREQRTLVRLGLALPNPTSNDYYPLFCCALDPSSATPGNTGSDALPDALPRRGMSTV